MVDKDLAVISLLADMGNGEVQDPVTDLPLVDGLDDPISTAGRIVHWDAEWHWDATYSQFPHQALGGHVVALGLTQAEQIWEEYTYPIFEWAHQQAELPDLRTCKPWIDGISLKGLNCCMPIEYPVEIALGSADFISEDVLRQRFLHRRHITDYSTPAFGRELRQVQTSPAVPQWDLSLPSFRLLEVK